MVKKIKGVHCYSNCECSLRREVEMEKKCPTNMPPHRAKARVIEHNAERISDNLHNFILDEIVQREALEYNPDRVYNEEDVDEEDVNEED